MPNEYTIVKAILMTQLEELTRIKASSADYLAALEDIYDEIDNWFEASIEAAKDDVRRQEREDGPVH